MLHDLIYAVDLYTNTIYHIIGDSSIDTLNSIHFSDKKQVSSEKMHGMSTLQEALEMAELLKAELTRSQSGLVLITQSIDRLSHTIKMASKGCCSSIFEMIIKPSARSASSSDFAEVGNRPSAVSSIANKLPIKSRGYEQISVKGDTPPSNTMVDRRRQQFSINDDD